MPMNESCTEDEMITHLPFHIPAETFSVILRVSNDVQLFGCGQTETFGGEKLLKEYI